MMKNKLTIGVGITLALMGVLVVIFPPTVALAYQFNLPDFPSSLNATKYARATYLPGTLTGLAGPGQNIVVAFLRFSNDDASLTAVIRVTDQSSDCGGAQCPIIPDVTLPPKSVYVVPLDSVGELSKSGVAWSATGSSKVFGYMRLKY